MPNTIVAKNLERRVRSRDADTSWIAAAGMSDEAITELQAWILVSLREKPMTDTELVDEHGAAVFTRQIRAASPQRIRTARKELELQQLVKAVPNLTRHFRKAAHFAHLIVSDHR